MFNHSVNATTVCIGYGDFLRESARFNARHFDKWTIVTSPDDHETREVCRQFALHCLVTEDANRDGDFSKGRLVERGLNHAHGDGWVCHIDADVVLHPNFRHRLMLAHLDPKKIYGCDRIMVKSWADWQKIQHGGWLHCSRDGYTDGRTFPPGYEIGSRWIGQDGFAPVGFWQLWHREHGGEEWRGIRMKPYPKDHSSCARTDCQFSMQWDRRLRELLPEVVVVHLESENSPKAINWRGRKSKRFEAPKK
jgi:hypothetical protein